METSFWHQKWETADIGFHKSEANPLLVQHFERLNVAKGSRVFLPLCGKTRDIAWLLVNGYQVAGAELSKIAVNQLFKELGVEPEISTIGELECYQSKNIDIFVGNVFDVSKDVLGAVDAIYDRAALVALPFEMRCRYSAHLTQVSDAAPQLLICYQYNQNLMDGPPFSITEEEVKQHYAAMYDLRLVDQKNVIGGLKGKVSAIETVWLLQKANQ